MRALLPSAAMFALIACVAASNATAQTLYTAEQGYSGSYPSTPYERPSYPTTPHSAVELHSSTAYGDVGKAISSIMKAYSNGMIDLAQARILNAEGYARERQNRVINTQTFIARQTMLAEFKQAERDRKRAHSLRMQQLMEERGRELADVYLPRHRFDPATGVIRWPDEFARPELAGFRRDMENLFRGLATEGPQYDMLYRDPIARSCKNALDLLSHQRDTMDWETYLVCKTMVRGLALKAENWPQAPGSYTTGAGQLASL